jgi:hypothetical protein
MTLKNTSLGSSIGSLIEMDQEEAALKEQLQQLARRKKEAKKTDGEKAKEELNQKIPDTRVELLGLLRTAYNLGLPLEDEYAVSLRRIVKDAGATGIALSLVQQVLPEVEKLQAARDQLGKNGTQEITELKAKEHLKEGKGRGLFFVWNEEEVPGDDALDAHSAGADPVELAAVDPADAEQRKRAEEAEPAPTPAPTPASRSGAATQARGAAR